MFNLIDKKRCRIKDYNLSEALLTCTFFICEDARFAPVAEIIYSGIIDSNSESILLKLEKSDFNLNEFNLTHNWSRMSRLVLAVDSTIVGQNLDISYSRVFSFIGKEG